MKTFEDSQKSKKTVASMIERKGEDKGKKSGMSTLFLYYMLCSSIFLYIKKKQNSTSSLNHNLGSIN